VKHPSEAIYDVEAFRIHQLLVSRIAGRAQSEGTPLSSLDLRQFESERMSKEEYRAFDKEFGGVEAWQPSLDRISGLLRRAIEEDAASDPSARERYEVMVHDLEQHQGSFTLWACCVPAISGYKSSHRPSLTDVIVLLFVVAVIASLILRFLKIL
jgi:hypothetical protein